MNYPSYQLQASNKSLYWMNGRIIWSLRHREKDKHVVKAFYHCACYLSSEEMIKMASYSRGKIYHFDYDEVLIEREDFDESTQLFFRRWRLWLRL